MLGELLPEPGVAEKPPPKRREKGLLVEPESGSKLAGASPPVVGLLGAEVLKSHHAIIDFGTRTLYLKE